MRVLLLSCGTGEYGDEGALALAESAGERGIDLLRVDPVAFGDDSAFITLDASYYDKKVKRKGTVGGLAYGAGLLYDKTPLLSPVYFSSARYADRIERFLEDNPFDLILATHLYGMEAVTALRRRKKIRIPSYGVLTDYAYIPFLKETLLDGYFLPHRDLIPVLEAKGMKKEKLVATGLPLRKRFSRGMGREAARNFLVIPKEKTVYLLFAEGLGSAKVAKFLASLYRLDPDGNVVYVITGRSAALDDGIREAVRTSPNARRTAYNDRINVYMEAADVIISPPDPFISTGAALLGIPLVHTAAHSGSESVNAEFFSLRKMSVVAPGPKSAARGAYRLAHDKAMTSHMARRQKEEAVPDGSGAITDIIIKTNGESDDNDKQ